MNDQLDTATEQPLSIFDFDRLSKTDKFTPRPASLATGAIPGSLEKLEILRARVANGEELWHPSDRVDFAGINGVVRTPTTQIPAFFVIVTIAFHCLYERPESRGCGELMYNQVARALNSRTFVVCSYSGYSGLPSNFRTR